MGLTSAQMNTGAVFFDGWGDLDYLMSQAQTVYPNGYDFIPVIGMHLIGASNHVSPATSRPYVWNDIQAYQDTANGLWDDRLWGLIPGIMKKYNRPCYILRPGFENNATFMPDFMGWDAESQEAFCKALRRIMWIQHHRARALGGVYPITGTCFTPQDPYNPNLDAVWRSIGTDVTNIMQYDRYNNFWLIGASKIPPGKRSDGYPNTPTEADLNANYRDGQRGGNDTYFLAKAKEYGLGGIFIPEVGSGNGGDHVPLDSDDRHFWKYCADFADRCRAAGVPWLGQSTWSVPAGDANCNMQDGSQPNATRDLRANYPRLIGDLFNPAILSGHFGTLSPVRIPGSTLSFPAVSL